MGLFEKIKGKVDEVNRNHLIKKQILKEKTINEDNIAFFEQKNGMTPKEYYTKKINAKQYYFKPTWTQDIVEINIPRAQFRIKGTVYNGENINSVDFNFREGQRTETIQTSNVDVKTKSRFGLGRAAVGGALLGPAGLLLGCTKKDKVIKTNKNGTSTIVIPTLKSEIIVHFNDDNILNIPLEEMDQDKCEILYKKADSIIEHLNQIKDSKQEEPRCFEESEGFEEFEIKVI